MRTLCIFLLLSVSTSLHALSMGEALNEASRQRMLSQKIAKAYFLKAIKPNSKSAEGQLKTSEYQFEHNLQELGEFKPAAQLNQRLAVISQMWSKYKTMLKLPATQDNAKDVLNMSNQILEQTIIYVHELQKISGEKTAELINLSGRQRMLSQRIAKNYLAHYWGLNDESIEEKLNVDLAEYENALLFLLDNPGNTEKITKKLQRVKGQLNYAIQAFDGVLTLSGDRIIFIVTGTTDTMLKNMDEITHLYANLLSRKQ